MTLKDMLNDKNYEIKFKDMEWFIPGSKEYAEAKAANSIYAEYIVQDMDNKQVILNIRDYGDKYKVAVYNKKQHIEKAIVARMIKEIENMYKEQELKKQRKKEEEARKKAEKAAKKFESKKNTVYLQLFDVINSMSK